MSDLSEVRDAIEMERTTLDVDVTDPATIVRVFREHSYEAALAITTLALHGSNERIRLDAAKYVVERAIGRIGDSDGQGDDPLQKLVDRILVEEGAAV